MLLALLIAAALLATRLTHIAAAEDPLDPTLRRAVDSLFGDIRTETLPNGLKIYLKVVPSSPLVTTMVAYRTGSGDEDADHTGLAHYLEHLMFKGTGTLMPGDIDKLTLRNGGANNAYTDTDHTLYHFDFAAEGWKQALKIEADRMRNIRIDDKHEFETEKGAVVEELKRDEDDPFDLEFKKICPLLFGAGPYGHPVIGEEAHVKSATAAVIKDYYDRWYHPNNASVIVVGGFDPDQAMSEIRRLFEPIPAGKLPQRKQPAAVERKGPVVQEFESKFVEPRLLMGFNGVKVGDPDDLALDLAAHLLAGSRASRLYRKLVEDEQVASEVTASNVPGRNPGWFSIQVSLQPDAERAVVEQTVLAELRKLADKPVDDLEFQRAVRSLSAGMVFAHESVHDLADAIAMFTAVTDLDYLRTYMDRLTRLKPADVQQAVKKHLRASKRVCVWSIPKPDPDARPELDPKKARPTAGLTPLPSREGLGEGNAQRQFAAKASSNSRFTRHATARSSRNPVAAAPLTLTDVRREALPNGLTLLLKEDHRLPVVHIAAEARDTHFREPADQVGVAELVARLLSEGTIHHTGHEIVDAIENVGGMMGFHSGAGAVKVLSPDRTLGLGILLECLSVSDFPKESFERHQEYLLSDIEDSLMQPDHIAPDLFRALVYGEHPLGRAALGDFDQVESLTREDCLDFHVLNYRPNNVTLAVVGDFDSEKLIAQITAMTRDWKRRPIDTPRLPVVKMTSRPIQRILPMPGTAQLQIIVGHLGVRRSNPDYYKLLVMDYVLGTGPGFTDRLTSRLRDREGLAYSVKGEIASSAGLEPGVFAVTIGTGASNFARVKKEIIEEITRIQDEKPTEQEVADAKAYLLGSLPFSVAKSDDAADLLLKVERLKLGLGYLEDFRQAVAAVTAEDVQQAARKYLDPKKLIIVAAGPVDPRGRPLEKEKQ